MVADLSEQPIDAEARDKAVLTFLSRLDHLVAQAQEQQRAMATLNNMISRVYNDQRVIGQMLEDSKGGLVSVADLSRRVWALEERINRLEALLVNHLSKETKDEGKTAK